MPILLGAAAAGGFLGHRRYFQRRLSPVPVAPLAPSESAGADVPSVSPPEQEPLPPPEPDVPTQVDLQFTGQADDLPDVWGLGEDIQLECRVAEANGKAVGNLTVELFPAPGEALSILKLNKRGSCRHKWVLTEVGEYKAEARFMGDEVHLPSSTQRAYRVVEFRQEVVRLYNEFLRWARERVTTFPVEATPREAETVLVLSPLAIDEKALEKVIRLFEEADYSEHIIGRQEYETMYRAWWKLTGGASG